MIVILSLCALFFIAINLQNILLKGSFESEYTPLKADYIVNATFKRCNINILKPEFAKITDYRDEQEINIAFYAPGKILSQTEADWDNSYTGGTTVKNTTFHELVGMVKKDCNQFQEGHGDYYGEDLAWSYSPYEPEPEKTQEEIEEEEYEEWVNDAIHEMRMENKD